MDFSWALSDGTTALPVRQSRLQELGIAQVRLMVGDKQRWFLWVAPTYFLFPSCWHVNDVMDMIVQWWKIWVMECSACWNCSVIKDFLSLRSVRLKAGAPLHVCRLLRRPLQPQILRPLPRLALARGPLLHLPQLALCLDWWELWIVLIGLCKCLILQSLRMCRCLLCSSLSSRFSSSCLGWTCPGPRWHFQVQVKRWFLKQTSRWQYFSGLFTLPPCCWLQSCWSTMWGWSRRVPPPLRQTARSGPTILAGARIGGRYWATAGTWLSSTPLSSRDSLTMGCSGTPRAPGDWRRQRTDEIRKALAAWLKGPTIDGSSGSQYYQVQ